MVGGETKIHFPQEETAILRRIIYPGHKSVEYPEGLDDEAVDVSVAILAALPDDLGEVIRIGWLAGWEQVWVRVERGRFFAQMPLVPKLRWLRETRIVVMAVTLRIPEIFADLEQPGTGSGYWIGED